MPIKTYLELQSADLSTQITTTFQKALANSSIIFTEPKEVEVLDDQNLTVELKVIDSLKKKDAASSTSTTESPFLNPEKDIIIEEDLLDDYRLLLNKFPVSENHFLLTTKVFKNQNDLLSPRELMATYDILKNLNTTKKSNYFAFYNSGPQSGFSQQHRHIQFVKYPLPNLKLFPEYTLKGKSFFIPKENDEESQPLCDDSMSFKHFILPLPTSFADQEEKEDLLSIVYVELFKKILNYFRNISIQQQEAQGTVLENNLNVPLVPISYNLVMNEKFIMVIPRQNAYYSKLKIGINAVGFIGLLLAKDAEQKQVILQDGVDTILAECGFPREDAFGKENEYDY